MTAPDDALAPAAAAVVAAAAPVILDRVADVTDWCIGSANAGRIAAAALAPALRELAAQANMMHAAEWLSRLADALDADAGGKR